MNYLLLIFGAMTLSKSEPDSTARTLGSIATAVGLNRVLDSLDSSAKS